MLNERAKNAIIKAALICSVSGAGFYVGAQIQPHSGIAYAKSVYQTTTTTSMRRGMSNDEKLIVKIPSNQTVDVIAVYKSGAWAKVEWNNKTGYIRTMYLKLAKDSGTSGSSPSASAKTGVTYQSDGYHMYAADTVTLRKSASSASAKLGTVKEGSDFILIDQKGSFYKIYVNKKYGWIPKSTAREYGKSAPSGSTSPGSSSSSTSGGSSSSSSTRNSSSNQSLQSDGYHMVTTANVNFRSGASTGSTRLGTLPKGSDVLIIDRKGDWLKVYVNKRYGYIHQNYAADYGTSAADRALSGSTGSTAPSGSGSSSPSSGQGTTSSGSSSSSNQSLQSDGYHMVTTATVNFRSGASSKSTKLGTLPKGSDVLLIDRKGDWFKVYVNKRYGYVHKNYVADYGTSAADRALSGSSGSSGSSPSSGSSSQPSGSSSSSGSPSGQSLRPDGYHMYAKRQTVLKKGPGTSYKTRTTISEGTDLLIIDQDGSWFKVRYNKAYSWVKKADLADYKSTPSNSGSSGSTSEGGSSGSSNSDSQRPVSIMTTRKSVRLLAGAYESASSRATLPAGTEVTVLNDWGYYVKVSYNGKDGYVHMKDLKKAPGYVSPSGSSSGSGGSSGGTVAPDPKKLGGTRSGSVTIQSMGSYKDIDIKVSGSVSGTTPSNVSVFLNGTYLGTGRISGKTFSYTIPSNVTRPGDNALRVQLSTGKGLLYQTRSFEVSKTPTIVVDAGHGGKDPGAIGTLDGKQIYEKDYSIKFADNLSQELKRLGFKVVMTRTTDYDVPRADRVATVHRSDADLLFSVHHNAASSSASGGMTLYPSEKNSPSSQAAFSESKDIADLLKRAYTSSGMTYRGAYRDRDMAGGSLYVLRSSDTRSILTEVGFISNTKDARKIVNPAFQKELPRQMAKQVYNFFYK